VSSFSTCQRFGFIAHFIADISPIFPFFCSDHHFRGLLRAVAASPEIEYINFQVHQSFAKRLAGAVGANYRDNELLDILYPFAVFKEPPTSVIDLEIKLEDLGK
jgi:hypothetical protein